MTARKRKSPKNKPLVLGTGLLALDIVINSQGLEEPRYYAGGTCGNVLSILSFMGWEAYPIARLNGDSASEHVLEDLRRSGVHPDFTSCKPVSKSPVIIQKIKQNKLGQGQHRFHFRCPKCGASYPRYKPVYASAVKRIVDKINSPNVFFFDRVSRGAIVLARAWADQGVLIMFEPSVVGDRGLFREAIHLAHILKYSNDRLQGVREIPTKGTNVVLEIETQGFEGLRFRNRLERNGKKGWQRLDAYEVGQVKDTAGAGDWCTASIINIIGRDGFAGFCKVSASEIVEALRYGQAAAAWNCRFEGARGGMQCARLEELEVGVRHIMEGTMPELREEDSNTTTLKHVLESLCVACQQNQKSVSQRTN